MTATTWAAVAAIAAATSSLVTLASVALLLRERREQHSPRLVLDLKTVEFNQADDRVHLPGGKPKDEWSHEMVCSLLNAGPGTAFGVHFLVRAEGDGVESADAGGAFVPVLLPGDQRELRIIFRTRSNERPSAFSYEPTPRSGKGPAPLLDMNATARDRTGRTHLFDSAALRVTQRS